MGNSTINGNSNGTEVSGPRAPPPAYSLDKGDDNAEILLKDIVNLNVQPLWTRMTKLNPPLPAPKAIPHKFEYKAIRPHLIRAGNLVTETQAERRVLMLINPAMDAPCTTDTLYAGLQLVMPGETAKAHRHTAFACRFIIEGHGGFTAVQGRRIQMHRGDFILTPTWDYHHYPVHFVQHYSEPRYPAEDAPDSHIIYPWSEMEAALEQEASKGQRHVIKRYTSKIAGREGQEVSKIIGAQFQETTSAVYHVIDGEGQSRIGNELIKWTKGDTFVVPSWQIYSHEAKDTTFLYRFDDRPMITALGFYRSAEEDFYGEGN